MYFGKVFVCLSIFSWALGWSVVLVYQTFVYSGNYKFVNFSDDRKIRTNEEKTSN